MIIEQIPLKKEMALGLKIQLGKAPLILIKARTGYIMCGYLNMDAANKLGDIAGKVSGVNDFREMLEKEVIEISERAKEMGIKPGITGGEFLEKIGDVI
ncbi:MAG: YunC family protein [Thermoplasmata archaeon]